MQDCNVYINKKVANSIEIIGTMNLPTEIEQQLSGFGIDVSKIKSPTNEKIINEIKRKANEERTKKIKSGKFLNRINLTSAEPDATQKGNPIADNSAALQNAIQTYEVYKDELSGAPELFKSDEQKKQIDEEYDTLKTQIDNLMNIHEYIKKSQKIFQSADEAITQYQKYLTEKNLKSKSKFLDKLTKKV